MKNFVLNLFVFLSVVFFAWGIVSFVEVNSQNLNANPEYSSYNMFVLFSSKE